MKEPIMILLEKELRKSLSNMKNDKYSYNKKLDLIINNETKRALGDVESLARFVLSLS